MNIKKKTTKLMSLLLSFAMTFSGVIPAYAMENTNGNSTAVIDGEDISADERNLEDITVTYKQASSFFVTIPKTIVLDGWKQSAYAVKVSGDIDADQCVYVAPVDGITDTDSIDFYMKDQASENTKEDVVANVTHNKFHWNSTEVAENYRQDDNMVSAPDLTAGAWRGIFQMEIKLETHVTHKHNYVTTITKEPTCTETGEKTFTCDCGDSYTEEIPAKGHNFENGECTDCHEKEADPYETAPANAYSNWNYTLDDTNNIITLNYYKGSETDVIVYANYVIGEKTYKTQLKSNKQGYYESRTYAYMFNADSHPNTATEDIKFTNNERIKSIKFSRNIDTSNVTGMGAMFYNCKSLTTIEGLDSFDTSNVTDMTFMFAGCESLVSLDISNFDTSNITNVKNMFNKCKSLTNLDISHFNTSNVTEMSYMFSQCESLIALNVNYLDTSKVTKMDGMFNGLSALTSLDVSNFDTSKVTNMGYMFDGCSTLSTLDLCSFDTRNATAMRNMFNGCSNLTTIYATEGKWSTSQASTSWMFSDCGTSTVTYK